MFYNSAQLNIVSSYLPDYLKLRGLLASDAKSIECLNPLHDKGPRKMGLFKGIDGKLRLKCHGCGKVYDLFNVIERIDDIRSLPHQYQYVCRLFQVDPNNPAPSKWGTFFQSGKTNLSATQEYIRRCALSPLAREKWATRKITDTAVRDYRLGYDDENDALVIPVGKLSYIQRFLQEGSMPKYKRAEGAFERFYSNIPDFKQPLVITEGEIDAISLAQFGLKNIIALGGIANLIPTYREFCELAGGRLIVFVDRDDIGIETFKQLCEACTVEGLYMPIDGWEYFQNVDLNGVFDINDLLLQGRVSPLDIAKVANIIATESRN